jgi:hypothetical protein
MANKRPWWSRKWIWLAAVPAILTGLADLIQIADGLIRL